MIVSGNQRSFVHHRLAQAGATFGEVGNTAGTLLALTVGSDDAATARRLGLADLSPLPRIGYKGAGAPAWLRQQNIVLPAQPNTAAANADGTLVAALSAQEHLLLAPLDNGGGSVCQTLSAAWSLDSAAQCYQLPRMDSHCWLAVSGEHSSDMLAKLCGVDLRPHKFAANAIAQTSMARVNTIVIHAPAQAPLFYILTDSASAEYLWDCLLDAMREFNGGIVGLNAIQDAAK